MERNAIGFDTATVFPVPRYGIATGGKLHPYLVRSARMKPYFYKRDLTVFPVIYRIEPPIFKFSILCPLARSCDRERLPAKAVTEKIVLQYGTVFGGHTANHR